MLAAGAAACLLGCACVPQGQLGQQGRLVFAHQADVMATPDMSTPLASGARAAVRVGAARTGARPAHDGADERDGSRWRYAISELDRVKIVTAESSDPEVVRVLGVDTGNDGDAGPLPSVQLEAGAPGRADLQVRTSRGPDTIALRVARVARVKVYNPMGALLGIPDWSFALLAGGTTLLWIDLLDEGDHELVGSDFPHAVDAMSGAVRIEQHLSRLELTPSEPGQILLHPYGATPAMALPVVSPREVIAVELQLCGDRACTRAPDIQVGDHLSVYLHTALADGRFALGVEGLAKVESQTPASCTIAMADAAFFRGQILTLSALAAGPCRVTAKLGDQSTEATWIVRQPPPPAKEPDDTTP